MLTCLSVLLIMWACINYYTIIVRFTVGGVNWLCSICSGLWVGIELFNCVMGLFSVNTLEHIYNLIMLTNIQECLLMFQQKNEDNKVYFGYLLWSYLFVRLKTTHDVITFNWQSDINLSMKKHIVLKSISKTIIKHM